MKTTLISKAHLAIFSLACISFATSAQATVITFESLASSGGGFNAVADGYSEGGYQFNSSTVNAQSFAVWQTGNGHYAGSTALFNGNNGSDTAMTHVGGGAFDMTSIDIASLLLNGGVDPIVFTGTKADATTVTNTFVWTTPNVLTTFNFTGMNNITKLVWSQSGNQHQFDNVTVATSVPEPGTVAALCLAPHPYP
jgi:hypothetical protein